MAEKTGISWTDHTASPWHGCQHAVFTDAEGIEHEHPGCLNCYAEEMAKRNPKTLGAWGRQGTRIVSKSFHANCRKWNREAEAANRRASVFPSICDPFEEWAGRLCFTAMNDDGQMENTVAWWRSDIGVCEAGQTTVGHVRNERHATINDLRRELFATIDACPWLDFLLLTKRPDNVRRMWARPRDPRVPGNDPTLYMPLKRDNVQLLTSVSNQATADSLTPNLRKCRDLVPVLGLSAEPLLGPIRLIDCGACEQGESEFDWEPQIDWVIIGGESGGKRRECALSDITGLVAQCRAAGVACFVKQDCALRPGQQGRIPADYWAVKEYPQREAARA